MNTVAWITLLTPKYKDQLLLALLNAGLTFKFVDLYEDSKTECAIAKLIFISKPNMWNDLNKMTKFKDEVKKALSNDILYHSIIFHPENSGSMLIKSNIDIKQYNKNRLIKLLE